MFETIRAFFRLLKLYAGGEYVLVHRARYLAVRNLVADTSRDLNDLRRGTITNTAVGLTDLTERVATLETFCKGAEAWHAVVAVLAKRAETIPTRPTPEEWARVKSLAEQAYDITVGIVPQSGIVATKAGVSGMPELVWQTKRR